MRTFTFVVEVPDDKSQIEKICREVLKDNMSGRLIYAYEQDAVADVKNILANSGTPKRLDSAVKRLQRKWWS